MRRYFFLFLTCISSLWSKPLKVDVSAPSALLMNAETGTILYAKNIHQRQYPASTTKIATALYVLEKKGHELDAVLEASVRALKTVPAYLRQASGSKYPSHTLEHDGTIMGLRQGEKHTLYSLLYGLLLSSGNDAANVLAEYTSGSLDQFMSELNQYLQSQGIQETHFTNPHGLHHHEHWTTAYDMALMTRLALKNKVFREVVKTTRYHCPQSNKQPARYLAQHNRLLKQGKYFYPKAIGVKTGYVAKAGHTFVGAATHEGRTLIAVLLNCEESEHRFRDSIKLFEAAFAEKLLSRVLFAKESDRFTRQVPGAKASLDAVLKDDLVLAYYPAEEPAFRAEIAWNSCKLPIKTGEDVGNLRLVADDGKILTQLPLVADHDVDQKWWMSFAGFCKAYKGLLIGMILLSQVVLFLLYFLKKNQKISQG